MFRKERRSERALVGTAGDRGEQHVGSEGSVAREQEGEEDIWRGEIRIEELEGRNRRRKHEHREMR